MPRRARNLPLDKVVKLKLPDLDWPVTDSSSPKLLSPKPYSSSTVPTWNAAQTVILHVIVSKKGRGQNVRSK